MQRPPKRKRICMRKTTLATQPRLSGPCKEFKFSVMKKENVGPVMLKEIFYHILKVSKDLCGMQQKPISPVVVLEKQMVIKKSHFRRYPLRKEVTGQYTCDCTTCSISFTQLSGSGNSETCCEHYRSKQSSRRAVNRRSV